MTALSFLSPRLLENNRHKPLNKFNEYKNQYFLTDANFNLFSFKPMSMSKSHQVTRLLRFSQIMQM